MALVKLIEEVFDGGRFWNVKFTDGTDAIAPKGKVFDAPLEKGEERPLVVERKFSEKTGRDFDLIVMWGTEIPVDERKARNAASVGAQAPMNTQSPPLPPTNAAPGITLTEASEILYGKQQAAKAPVRPAVAFDSRELSIMAQVALKEATVRSAQEVAIGGKKSLPTTAATIKTARAFLKGMLDMVTDAKAGNL